MLSVFDIFRQKNNRVTLSEAEARRLCEIISESLGICQSTTNPDVFFSRLNLAESECRKVVNSGIKGTYGKAAGNLLAGFPDAKESLTNAFLKRAFSDASAKIDKLKTNSGKKKHLDAFSASIHEFEHLLSSKNQYLIHNMLSSIESQDETSYDSIDNAETEDIPSDYTLPSAKMQKFYSLSEQIGNNKDVEKKLRACEASYGILPDVIEEFIKRDHELPPEIYCRDVGPELYMRLGRWDCAARAIKVCIDADAYYPNTSDEGENELQYLRKYMDVANAAVDYIKSNPGTLQKDIYKNLKELDRDTLKTFTRSSLLIRKEKFGNTNKLYIV